MRVIGFCDYESTELKEQIDVAKSLEIDQLLIRKINNLKVYEFDDALIKETNQILKTEKISIVALDPLIKNYDLYDIDKFDEVLNMYENAINVAVKLRVSNLYFRLPIIKDILEEFETVKSQLDRFVELARKAKITLLINQEEEKTNVLVYILKKYRLRDLQLVFNPATTVTNDESPIVAYRLLKDYFSFFVSADIDKKNNPELLGYGRVKIIDIFKRMNRDQYKGYFILDDRFGNFVSGNEEKKVSWFKKIFKSKPNIDNYLRGYSLRIFPNQEVQDVTVFDIYENQINVLKIAFRL